MGNLVDLSKKAGIVLEKKQLTGVKAEIIVATDISYSMYDEFRLGKVQEVLDRLLGIGMNMDTNKAIDVYAFNNKAQHVGEVSERNHADFVKKVFMKKAPVSGGTDYAPIIELIMSKYGSDKAQKKGILGGLFKKKLEPAPKNVPTFVFFITDGETSNRIQVESALRNASNQPVFWQFIGIGYDQFGFLRKLDELEGRYIDNASFFAVNDIAKISDEELYDRLLTEFPSWLDAAKRKGLLS